MIMIIPCNKVWELSKIFIYAASVSCIVRSYSLRAWIFLASASFIDDSLSVSILRSLCIFAFSSSSFRICLFISSRFSRKSSIHFTFRWYDISIFSSTRWSGSSSISSNSSSGVIVVVGGVLVGGVVGGVIVYRISIKYWY